MPATSTTSDLGWRLVILTGSGRSGSTLLQRLLAQYPDTHAVGEAIGVWDRAYPGRELCGCGERLTGCAVWRRTLDRLGVDDMASAERMIALRAAALGWRRLLALAAGRPTIATRAYLAALAHLYSTFAGLAGASVLVDSSKQPDYATMLMLGFPERVTVVHLVRDPRAVAFSLQRHVRRRDVPDSIEFMPRYNALRAALSWVKRNILAELTSRAASVRVRVRYEDLLSAPSDTLARLRSELGMPPVDATFLAGDQAMMSPLHSVGGNPSRLDSGSVTLRLDDEWRAGLSDRQGRLVLLLCWPLMRRYAYWGRGAEAPLPHR